MLEVCCGSYMDGITAYKAGVKRIELNSALYLGGLTPSIASLLLLKKETDLKIICMVRCRGAGFLYNDLEYKQMYKECKDLLDNGADGIAFGFLNDNFTIDINKTKEFVELIHSYHKEAVFHRAFDLTDDPISSIKTLIDCKVDRVLTSGQAHTAIEGIDVIKELLKYEDCIQILAGCGINKDNVGILLDNTNIKQIHASCKDYLTDTTTCNHVDFGYRNNTYEYVNKDNILDIMEVLQDAGICDN